MRRKEVAVISEHDGLSRRVIIPGGTMSSTVARELLDVGQELVEDRTVRVITLAAESQDFCLGSEEDLDPYEIDPTSTWARLRPPVIAAVSGRCTSVGFELVLVADIRVCAAGTVFALADVLADRLPCWGGTQRLARAIRPAEATAMLLLGTELDAERAMSLGLVHATTPDTFQTASHLADRLVTLAPLALELMKEAVLRGVELPLRDGLVLEGDLNHLLSTTDDRQEGLDAFLGKRTPHFRGC